MNTTIYTTIELACYMKQPFKTYERLYKVLQLLPNEGSHISFSVKKLLKDYFSAEAKGMNLIAYIEGDNYYVDIDNGDETLNDIKKKHMIKGIVNSDKTITVKV